MKKESVAGTLPTGSVDVSVSVTVTATVTATVTVSRVGSLCSPGRLFLLGKRDSSRAQNFNSSINADKAFR
ncbi:MAG: hypothetical protein GC181_09830 [Bacteroidetes bacterium]|nr:hypothetical protein [Bacteroidota bacterium]